MNIEKLEQFLQENNLPKFRLGQIQKAIFSDGVSSFEEITTLSKDLREKMEAELKLLSFDVEKVLTAKDGQSIKALLKLTSGDLIETVLIGQLAFLVRLDVRWDADFVQLERWVSREI
jgi:23S rRNA (adenine2503-C2)-methyltransferase